FPRRLEAHAVARFARLLRATLEAGLAHPSRLLAFYLQRLMQPAARPLAPLEVLWQLAETLGVHQFEEERQQGAALRQAIDALWVALAGSEARLTALRHAAVAQRLEQQADFGALCTHLMATTPDMTPAAAAGLLGDLLSWLTTDVPAITAVLRILESTQLHTLLTINDDLSLTRPAYLQDAATLTHLHGLLSKNLRPAVLRHGELLSPMEATIYHQPEPGAPPFIAIGEEVKVGQTIALLEAMKMFTELPSPVDGVLVDILVESGQGVKTGTPLFRIATQDAAIDLADDFIFQVVEGTFQNRFGLLVPETHSTSAPDSPAPMESK
ncbi:MAG TPA: acetyl-CoA carboxylase biotin carboxyl carrier protein subunit, partial [Candidatus Tectomicrobia bacterium]